MENTWFVHQYSQLHCLWAPIHFHGNVRKPPEFSFGYRNFPSSLASSIYAEIIPTSLIVINQITSVSRLVFCHVYEIFVLQGIIQI